MRTSLLLFASMTAGFILAQEPSGTISANPNPCQLESGRHDCTTILTWETRGVQKAKVFVTAEGRHPGAERVFSDSVACQPGRCRAPWIEPETRYLFQLVDFSRGDRGRTLASITVTAGGQASRNITATGQPSGSISAEPNPCRIVAGQHDCMTRIRWQTQGVQHARVYVIAEGRHPGKEREFGTSISCEGNKCGAPWIEPDTRYTFQLFDFSGGGRGKMLGSVVVTAVQ